MVDTAVNLAEFALVGRDSEILIPDIGPARSPPHGTQIASILNGAADGAAGALPTAKIVAIDAFYRNEGRKSCKCDEHVLASRRSPDAGFMSSALALPVRLTASYRKRLMPRSNWASLSWQP